MGGGGEMGRRLGERGTAARRRYYGKEGGVFADRQCRSAWLVKRV